MNKILIRHRIEYHLDVETMTFFTKEAPENICIGQVIRVPKDNHVEYMIVTDIDEKGVWGVLYNKMLDVDKRRKQCQKTFFDM